MFVPTPATTFNLTTTFGKKLSPHSKTFQTLQELWLNIFCNAALKQESVSRFDLVCGRSSVPVIAKMIFFSGPAFQALTLKTKC